MPARDLTTEHYGTADLIAAVTTALQAAGFGDGVIAAEALAASTQVTGSAAGLAGAPSCGRYPGM